MANHKRNLHNSKSSMDLLIGKAQEIIRVTNEAMVPMFSPGDILILERLPSSDTIIWGMPYVIVLNSSDVLIRRVFWEQGSSNPWFLLVSGKADQFPNKSIRVDRIESIFKIISVVTLITERIELL